MRKLGTQGSTLLSTAPSLAIIVFDASSNEPQFIFAQEANTDMPILTYKGQDFNPLAILDDVTVTSARPQSGGGLRRNTCKMTLRTNDPAGRAFINSVWGAGLYYGGVNQDSFYFGIWGFDRSKQFSDITKGCCYGLMKVDQEVDWNEADGLMSLGLIDVSLVEDDFIGATDEIIPDSFFYYNSWYGGDFFPIVYGQVQRIKMLNSFPSFNTKQLANTITGLLYTAYLTTDGAGTVLTLEEQVDRSSLLLQLVALGGIVRIRFANGEVMSGTLAHNTGANTVEFTIVSRNTYYAQVQAFAGEKSGQTPDQWPTPACYSTVDLDVNTVVIKDAKNTIIEPNGFIQVPNFNFYKSTAIDKNDPRTNIVTQMQGLLTQRKDTVLIKPFRDPSDPTTVANVNISTFFTIASNAATYPSGWVVSWGLDLFEFEKYYNTTRPINLFINDPATANAAGNVGDAWSVVAVEPASLDISGYIRNGYGTFSNDHVYCEGEGKLIKIPTANVVSVTDNVSAYGLTNLAQITLTDAPLNLNIGAKSNVIYTDCIYPAAHTYDPWMPAVIKAFITRESPFLTSVMGEQASDPSTYTDNAWPYIGMLFNTNTTITQALDKLCYQGNFLLAWQSDGTFEYAQAGYNGSLQRVVTIDSIDYIQPLALATDENELTELTAQLQIGKLKTTIDNGLEHVKLHLKTSFGAWQDPFFATSTNDVNRGLKPESRIISYAFDFIQDSSSFEYALGASLSIGHASGYSTIQKRIISEMGMQGCRWEAMDPIIFKNYPRISDADSNVYYGLSGELLYAKPLDGQTYFIMGALCVIDQVDYIFNVIGPKVVINARMAQAYVNDVSGATSGGSTPPTPPLGTPPTVSTDPNSPPNKGSGHGSGSGGSGFGLNFPMPLVISDAVAVAIDDTTNHMQDVTITADDGFIFDEGYDYAIFIRHPLTGASLSAGDTGTFANKSGTPQPVYTLTINVDYRWFSDQSVSERSKPIIMEIFRYFSDDPDDYDSQLYVVPVTRLALRNVVAS